MTVFQGRLRIRAGGRLHFGLLSWGDELPRRYGGLGLMVESPGLSATIEPGEGRIEGPGAERARDVVDRLRLVYPGLPPFDLRIEEAPREHVGLGSGTQLSLAIGRLVSAYAGGTERDAASLARLTGRGRRSGVGLHGFDRGGLLVDGGHGAATDVPPLVARLDFPEDWNVVVVIPPNEAGLHGEAERAAFAVLPPCPPALTDRLCRRILLELLPSVAERDLAGFGQALEEIQLLVGRAFAPAQGAAFSHPRFDEIAAHLRDFGLVGIGQSSWGPAIYGFGPRTETSEEERLRRALEPFGATVHLTRARNRGAELSG